MPFVTVDAYEFELLTYLAANNFNVTKVIGDYTDPTREYHEWGFLSYLNHIANKELDAYEYPLAHRFETVFTKEAQVGFTSPASTAP